MGNLFITSTLHCEYPQQQPYTSIQVMRKVLSPSEAWLCLETHRQEISRTKLRSGKACNPVSTFLGCLIGVCIMAPSFKQLEGMHPQCHQTNIQTQKHTQFCITNRGTHIIVLHINNYTGEATHFLC